MTTNEQLAKWYEKSHSSRNEVVELSTPVDIVVIDRETRVVECITVWIALVNIERIRKLVARETGTYGDSLVVCVESRMFGCGDIITSDKEINI